MYISFHFEYKLELSVMQYQNFPNYVKVKNTKTSSECGTLRSCSQWQRGGFKIWKNFVNHGTRNIKPKEAHAAIRKITPTIRKEWCRV